MNVIIYLVSILAFCASPSLSMAAQEFIFLKFSPEMKGTAKTKGFEDQIAVNAFSYKVTNGKGSTTLNDVTIQKIMDHVSPSLAQASAEKRLFDSAEITMVNGKSIVMKVELGEVVISSVAIDYTGGSKRPTETMTLAYNKVIWEKGGQKTGWNQSNNPRKKMSSKKKPSARKRPRRR